MPTALANKTDDGSIPGRHRVGSSVISQAPAADIESRAASREVKCEGLRLGKRWTREQGSKGGAVEATISSTDVRTRPAWLLLLGCMFCSMVTASPIIATTVSVFILPISKEFGWARTQFPLIIL